MLWLGVAVACAAHGFTLFAGRYLPYIDLPGHLALISALAHGGETGALTYLDRTFAPNNPYYVFYVLTATIGQLVTVDVAAKVSLLIATALYALSAASLCDATGRSPRLGAGSERPCRRGRGPRPGRSSSSSMRSTRSPARS